jgi:uncharacterized protein YraI
MPTFTPTPENAAFVEATPINIQPEPAAVSDQPLVEAEPTEPPTPTFTPEPTATPDNTVIITFQQNMNIRSGPGTNYGIVGAGTVGETARVIGRNQDGSWLQVEYAGAAGGIGWIYTQLVEVKGQPESVAVAEAPPPPPPPTRAPEPEPQQPAEPPKPQYQFTPTGWHASHNAAIVHFKGRIRDEAGNLVNGYSVLIDNWAFKIISHPTGASHWYPEKGDGEWDISGVPLANAVGWWYLSVVRYECPGFFEAGFNSQCNQFTRLSEEVKIEVVYPDETVINADWVCHWDCDKGLYTQAFRR